MAANQCNNQSIPISRDVSVTVTKSQVISTTDLSIPVFVSATGGFVQGPGRIRYYSTITSLEADWGTSSEAYKAGSAFFQQNPRPQTMAVAQAFSTDLPGILVTGITGSFETLKAIDDGSFSITIDGVTENITGLSFLSTTSFDDVATALQAAIQAVGTGGYTAATVEASGGSSNQFTIKSGTTGAASSVISLVSAIPIVGTDISVVGLLNGPESSTQPGYVFVNFTTELVNIAAAATCAGTFVYGWVLDAAYRDEQEQLDAIAWMETQPFGIIMLETNSTLAITAGDTSSNIFVAFNNQYQRTCSFYSTDVALYYGMAYLAILLSVDYGGANTALTMKFKNMVGVTPVIITETELDILESKRCNTFTIMSNSARTDREGVQANNSWYSDDLTNVDNYVNELLSSVYNVFTTTNKVPFTNSGIALLYSAEALIGERYIRNGVLADRLILDTQEPSGFRTVPAYQIIFQPLQNISQSNRDDRLLTGNQIALQLAGAIHKLIISINVTE